MVNMMLFIAVILLTALFFGFLPVALALVMF